MAPRLPLEVLERIIDDIVPDPLCEYGLYNSLKPVKACALVCHSFLPLCRKIIFAFVALNEPGRSDNFDRLLSNSPHLAMYIRKLNYRVEEGEFGPERSPWLSSMFKKLVKLQKLRISYIPPYWGKLDWMALSGRMVLLPLLHLPTLTSICLETIFNFPLADLAGCVNLKQLEVQYLDFSNGVGKFLEVLPPTQVMLERLRTIVDQRGFETVQRLCDARRPDGKPIIDFSSLREITAEVELLDSMKDFFGMCRNLHKIDLFSMSLPYYFFIHFILLLLIVDYYSESTSSLKGLFAMLKPSLPTLVTIVIKYCIDDDENGPLGGLCHELEKMAGQNMVETIELVIWVPLSCDCTRWGELDDVLMGSPGGWPALRKVSLSFQGGDDSVNEALRELPMTKLVESKQVQFDFDINKLY